MTQRFTRCGCDAGIDPRDGKVCIDCGGAGGHWREAPPVVSLVCGHQSRSSLRRARIWCQPCGADVEVADPARLDEQLARFAAEVEERIAEREAAPLWGWPVPTPAERARLEEQRIEAVIVMRRAAGAARARMSKREAA